MNWELLAALAVGPGLVLTHFFWVRDRNREPIANLFLYFVVGAIAVVPAAFVESWLSPAILGGAAEETASLSRLFVFALVGVALVEETLKRTALGARALFDRHIDEPFDWIVYSVTAALGFATAENFAYVFQYGASTGIVRAFTAVPAHAFDGTIMGCHLALAATLPPERARRHRWLAVVEPALWHAAYDFPLFVGQRAVELDPASKTLSFAWVAVFVLQWRVCIARVSQWSVAQRGSAPPVLYVRVLVDEMKRRAKSRS